MVREVALAIEKLVSELAAARPVLEAVVLWHTGKAPEWGQAIGTMISYADAQRAARAGKSPDATNDTNGGM